MNSQNEVYECSRSNAQTKISNSQWINEWNDGIKLNKGDTVRLLGSFISEAGDGNDIAINEDTKFTMDFEPYLNAETVNFGGPTHADFAGDFQIKLGDIAQPAYSTDNFGAEPPYTPFDLEAQAVSPSPVNQNKRIASDRFNYRKEYGAHVSLPYNYPETNAVKIGCYMDTSSGTLTADDMTNENLVPNTLSAFNQLNLSQEFRVAHLCKLIELPLFHGLKFFTTGGATHTHTFDPADIIKAGDYISTYHIGAYPTQLTPTSNSATTTPLVNDTDFGGVQWAAGPQSMVGRVLATKYKIKQIYDPNNNVTAPMEFLQIYVQDWINPGQYKYENDIDVTARAPRHGAPEKKNGYNTCRNSNKMTGNLNGTNTGGVFTAPGTAVLSNVAPYYYNLNNSFTIGENQEMSNFNDFDRTLEGCTNLGLSFPWAGKGSWRKQLANCPDLSIADYPVTMCSSWVEFTSALTGVIADGFGRNQLAMTLGDNFLYVDSAFTRNELRTTYYNINSPCYTDSTAPFYIGNIEDIEEVARDPNFANQTAAHYYKITISAPLAGDYAINTIDFHYQRELGGWDWKLWNFTYKYGEEDILGGGAGATDFVEYIDSKNWNDVGAIVTLDPNDDNNIYKNPTNPAYIKRLYCPYKEQAVASPNTTRNMNGGTWGVNGVPAYVGTFASGASGKSAGDTTLPRLRHIFGQSPPYLGGGDMRSATDRAFVFPYSLGTGPFISRYFEINGYNESCNSVYFQTEDGSGEFHQPGGVTNPTLADKMWKEDLLYIKKYKTEFKIPAGFYQNQRMADIINEQLHYPTEEYYNKVGTNTTVGQRERALTSGNNVVWGNFIQSYIPEVSYGFIPYTTEAAAEANNSNFPDPITDNCNSLIFDYGTDLLNPQTVVNSNQYSYYTVPYTHKADGTEYPQNDSVYCFRLIGSRILQTSFSNQMDQINPSALFSNRNLDVLAATFGQEAGGTPEMSFIYYQNRGYKNRLMYGGAAKCWVGAVNPTFSFDAEELLYNWSFLYTPYRPATDESGSTLTLVGGLSVPSAIINTLNSGEITDSLSGIYINNLVGSQISASNTTPQFDFFNNGFSTPIGDYVNKATLFWNTLGFSNQLLDSYNTGTLNLPYIYLAENSVVSNILRNQAEVDISANGSNPLKSYCSLWAPPLQYSIICESNQKFGDKRPQYATTPFYLIGSSFPSKQYYGGKGTKLPVMGVCSRQFSSFGFAFDLSESSITYTIDQDCTITSIETKIYNNDYTIPQNLDSNSSVIYVIERNNYYPSPTVQQLQAIEEEDEKEAAPINYTPSMFEYQGNLNYEAPLYLIDSDDEDLE
tara:strand:+ start:1300 stop:5259 length:3960 start_codon:yes stop_codon:yes gene_type:complete